VFTLNKRNRRQLSRSALAHAYPAPRTVTVHFASAAEFTTVTGGENRNVTVSRPERGFSPLYVKETRSPAVVICRALSCDPTLSARDARASRLELVPRLRYEGWLAKAG
jgi:hypothetical protein